MTSRLPRSGPLFLVIASLVASLALAPSPVLAQDPPDFWLPLECGQTYYGYTYNTAQAPNHGGSGINAIDFHQDRPLPGANQDVGDEVLASAAGKVIAHVPSNGELTIDHPGTGWQTQYAHMTDVAAHITTGELVEVGELLGFISDVGVPTGQGEAHHLHYQQNQGTSQAQVANFAEYGPYQYDPDTYEYPAISSGLCFLDPPFTDHFDSPLRTQIDWLYQDQKQALGGTISYEHPVFSCDTIRYCELETVSRAAVAVFLAEFRRLPAATQDYFTDDNGLPEEAAINRVAEAGIAGGCGGTNFCPNFTASRDHMAVFLVRALGLEGELPIGDHFTDDDSSLFEDEINILADRGIVRGCGQPGQQLYCPSAAVSKDHLAVFLYNARDYRP